MVTSQISPEDINLGLPIPKNSRLRFIKKVVAKLNWPFLSHQIKINNSILSQMSQLSENEDNLTQAVNGILGTLDQIQFSLAHHTSVLERFEQTLSRHDTFIHHNEEILTGNAKNLEHHQVVLTRLDKTAEEYGRVLQHHDEVCTRQDLTLESHESYISHIKEISDHYARLSILIELVQQQSFTRLHETLGPLQETLNSHERLLSEQYDAVNTRIQEQYDAVNTRIQEQYDAVNGRIQEQYDAVNGRIQEQYDAMNNLTEVQNQKTLSTAQNAINKEIKSIWPRLAQVDLFLNEVKRSLPAPPTKESLAKLPSAFEGLYAAFEESFRGPETLIQSRLEVYLPFINQISNLGPVLDIGCGRGEFLEMCAQHKINAYGVDSLQENVERCKRKGLTVQWEDAFEHLQSVKPDSLSVITAIHIIEHLDLAHQIELIDRALAALVPGGMLIIETPNPENVLVGSCYFYMDPTHVKPIPPALLEFFLNTRGFIDVDILRHDRDSLIDTIDDIEHSTNDGMSAITETLSTLFNSAPDYAVIGKKIA